MHPLSSADPWERIADEQSITRLPPNAVSTRTIPGGSVLTSPISAASSQPGTTAGTPEPSSAASGRDEGDELALVRHVHRVDPQDLAGARDRGRNGNVAPRRTRTATPDARASSFSTVATPPRVASRMQRSAGPAASSSASTAGQSERVSDSTSASSSNSPRASMTAVPCSPIGPDTRMRSPGCERARRERRARSSSRPMPGRRHVHRVALAALDDLRVAGDDLDAGRLGSRGDRLYLGAQRRRRPALPRARARA